MITLVNQSNPTAFKRNGLCPGPAVFLWNEPFTRGHVVAFTCIWTGLALISIEQIARLRRKNRLD